jgi:hypothetical protein
MEGCETRGTFDDLDTDCDSDSSVTVTGTADVQEVAEDSEQNETRGTFDDLPEDGSDSEAPVAATTRVQVADEEVKEGEMKGDFDDLLEDDSDSEACDTPAMRAQKVADAGVKKTRPRTSVNPRTIQATRLRAQKRLVTQAQTTRGQLQCWPRRPAPSRPGGGAEGSAELEGLRYERHGDVAPQQGVQFNSHQGHR